MNCMIVDDEELAHSVIEEYISRTPFLKLKKTVITLLKQWKNFKNLKLTLFF
jgi:hypothetical protein